MASITDEPDAIRALWQELFLAEYCGAARSAETLHGLIAAGLSAGAIAACHRIVSDQLERAELCRSVWLSAGADDVGLEIPRERLSLPVGSSLPWELRLLWAGLAIFCVEGGLRCAVSAARRVHPGLHIGAALALDRMVRDDARSLAFGWDLVDELIEITGRFGATWLRERVPEVLAGALQALREPERALSDEERRYGLIGAEREEAVVRATLRERVLPSLSVRGLVQ